MPLSFRRVVINNLLFLLLCGFFSVNALAADIIAPTSSLSKTPVNPDGENGWYVSPVEFTISATDLESGVNTINYKVDSSSWVSTPFNNGLNLAPNPSMEDIDNGNTPIITSWDATVLDADTSYIRDGTDYAPGYATTSAKIITTGTGWHGINNQTAFSAASPMANMSASVWVKTENVIETAYFKVYLVLQDIYGVKTYSYLTQSTGTTGTVDWSKLSVNFVVNDPLAIGVYVDIGLTGTGTVWADAVSITTTTTNPSVNFTIGTNGTHTVEYYSTDVAENAEIHSCSDPKVNCATIKIDQTVPGNFHDSGAFRGFFGNDHQLWVYTNVEDADSGLSVFTDKYQYHTDKNPGFGRFSNILSCNSTWQPDGWVILISPPFQPGVHSAYLLTPKTEFCNNDWKTCKTVRFYVEDMAGNSTTKDFCLNGPWVQFLGGGVVKANAGIDMLAEPNDHNSDGLVETGNDLINFFSTSKDWYARNSVEPKDYNYNTWYSTVKPAPTTITGNLRTTTGVYLIDSNYEITNANLPNNFDNDTFNQIYFINGDLKVSYNVAVSDLSTALFIVKGKVEIDKSVGTVGIAVFADGDLYTAYNTSEGEGTGTLDLKGVYVANKFVFQRTLQGTNNNNYPSESFTFEPKYAIKLADYLGTNSIKWVSAD